MLPISTMDVVRYVPLEYDSARAQQILDGLRADPAADKDAIAAAERHLAKVEANLAACGGQPPVYLIRVPSLRARAAWRRDVAASGARMPSNAEMFEAMRAALREVAPANLDALLEMVDQAEYAAEKGEPLDAKAAREIGALETQLLSVPVYSVLQGARQYWASIAPIIAAQHFIAGWESVGAPYETSRGLVTDAALEALPRGHAEEAGWHAIGLMSVSKDQTKNSASPSRSLEGPKPSAAAQTLSTADAAGTSSAKSTSKTRR